MVKKARLTGDFSPIVRETSLSKYRRSSPQLRARGGPVYPTQTGRNGARANGLLDLTKRALDHASTLGRRISLPPRIFAALAWTPRDLGHTCPSSPSVPRLLAVWVLLARD